MSSKSKPFSAKQKKQQLLEKRRRRHETEDAVEGAGQEEENQQSQTETEHAKRLHTAGDADGHRTDAGLSSRSTLHEPLGFIGYQSSHHHATSTGDRQPAGNHRHADRQADGDGRQRDAHPRGRDSREQTGKSGIAGKQRTRNRARHSDSSEDETSGARVQKAQEGQEQDEAEEKGRSNESIFGEEAAASFREALRVANDPSARNRRFMHLFLEPKEMVEASKARRTEPIVRKRHSISEYLSTEQLNIQIPQRPPWTYEMTKEEVETNEANMMEVWLRGIFSRFRPEHLNYFECNLEVWRQLWRTVERADCLAVIVDIRHPLLHIPSSVSEYILRIQGRKMAIVLNKCDLVSEERRMSWISYLRQKFRLETENGRVQIVLFSNRQAEKFGHELIHTLQNVLGCHRVGLLGHPSVGKSSLLNALCEKKVVSTSRTPGHTKHFQTIHVNKDLMLIDCPGLMFPVVGCPRFMQVLCGLFPLSQIREPFSAIRALAEHCPTPLWDHYKLKHPSLIEEEPNTTATTTTTTTTTTPVTAAGSGDVVSVASAGTVLQQQQQQQAAMTMTWSSYDICAGYAYRKGYRNKGGAPNVHRAAYEILRDCVDGVLDFSFEAPEDHENEARAASSAFPTEAAE